MFWKVYKSTVSVNQTQDHKWICKRNLSGNWSEINSRINSKINPRIKRFLCSGHTLPVGVITPCQIHSVSPKYPPASNVSDQVRRKKETDADLCRSGCRPAGSAPPQRACWRGDLEGPELNHPPRRRPGSSDPHSGGKTPKKHGWAWATRLFLTNRWCNTTWLLLTGANWGMWERQAVSQVQWLVFPLSYYLFLRPTWRGNLPLLCLLY